MWREPSGCQKHHAVTNKEVLVSNSFQLSGIGHETFEPLFKLSDKQLDKLGVQRVVATECPGYPCRVGLQDADIGEELLLLPYEHQPALSPYRASGPIFVRRGSQRCILSLDTVPNYVTSRLISVRAYDADHMMVDAVVCEGAQTAAEIKRCFSDGRVSYIHLHNAKRGCFSCEVLRA